jgi:cell division protein FtsI/penicillin-binding protein 2
MLSSVGRIVLLVTLLVALLVLGTALVTAFRQEPPPAERHYLGLSWTELKRDGRKALLFSVTPTATGLSVASGAWRCTKNAVSDGDDLTCADRLFRYERSSTSDRLILEGFRVRKGGVLSIGSGQEADVVVRGPGVGARHATVWTLPSAAAPCDPKEKGSLCLENGGASGTVAVYTEAGRRSSQPSHGAGVTVSAGDEVWLGYVPFTISSDKDGLVFTVPLGANARDWTELRGDRDWQRLEMASWSFRRNPAAAQQHDFYPEAALDHMKRLGGKGDLAASRVEVQQEETVQKLIDHELLCLDRDAAAGGTVPRLRWRDPSNPGCNGRDLQHDLRLAVPPDVERMFRAARIDRSINRFVALSARRLAEDEFVDDPSELPLIFDYRFKPVQGGLRRTPVRLLGVRPEVSFHRARRQQVADSSDPDIRFAAQSDSPRFEITALGPSLAGQALTTGMQLLLAPAGAVSPRQAWIGAGGSAPAGAQDWVPPTCQSRAGTNCGPAVLVLGSAWFGQGQFAWLAAPIAAPANGTSASFTVERKDGAMKTTMTPHGTPLLRNGEAVTRDTLLSNGDTVVIGDLTLTYEDGDGLAATSRRAGSTFHRVYPAGRDALQLIGYGSRIGGIEASLDTDTVTLARQQWKDKKTPIELTVRADLQHIVARELNAAVNRVIGDTSRMNDAQRRHASKITGSAVLMNAAGDVLAVGNAPTANIADVEELEQTLLEEERRHSEGRQAADQKLLNHAFLRALPVGSTQKIATSLALFRENRWPRNDSNASCTKHLRGYWIRSTRRTPTPTLEPLGKYDCNGNHGAALPVGSQLSWQHAFRDSCDVYFGLAALGLTPGYNWALGGLAGGPLHPGLSQAAGETRVIFSNDDPARLLRPGSLLQPVPGDGDAYTETLLLLGFRFASTFEGKGVNAQTARSYDGIVYPTADQPWLPGLASAFVYPTLAGPDGYSNVYARGGIQKTTPRTGIDIDGTPCNIQRDHQWVEYLMTGWGQNVTGNALSIATSALPIVDDGALMPQPHILKVPAATTPPPARPPVLNSATLGATRDALRAGLRDVVINGTAKKFFAHSSVQSIVGGKTGTIQIEMSEPEYSNASNPEAVRRMFRYGCGVLDSGADQNDWNVMLVEYRRVLGHDSGWTATLPVAGFAEGSSVCTAPFNPGLPRSVEVPAGAPSLASWEELIAEELAQNDLQKVVSSAFVAVTLAPLANPPATPPATATPAVPAPTPQQARDAVGEGWVLGVIVDDRMPSPGTPTTAKEVSVAILESLQRYLEVRNR